MHLGSDRATQVRDFLTGHVEAGSGHPEMTRQG
jgi:hypothetical protein